MANHKLNSALKQWVLPPTREAFQQHEYRAHMQAAIRRCALNADPHDLIHVHYGWPMNADTNKLVPISVPVYVLHTSESVLKMIKCGYSSSEHCSIAHCSCTSAWNRIIKGAMRF